MKTGLIFINPISVTRVLTIIAVVIVLTSIAWQVVFINYGRMHGLVDLFNVDRERNIPTAFSTFLMLFAALLLASITLIEKTLKKPASQYWLVLFAGLSFMALDEAWSCHEFLISPIRYFLGGKNLGIFFFSWVVAAIPAVVVLALFFSKFLWHLEPKTRNVFILSAFIYLAGAIGFELIGGRYAEMYGDRGIVYNIFVTLEETLEMAGIIVFIRSLLEYIADHYNQVQVQFGHLKGSQPQLSVYPAEREELTIGADSEIANKV